MIAFFPGGFLQPEAQVRVAFDERLAVIETLRGDLPGVVHPHETGAEPALGLPEVWDGFARSGRGAGGGWGRKDGTQPPVQGGEKMVAGRQMPIHDGHII